MAEKTSMEPRLAYAAARLVGDDDLALRIAFAQPEAFEWSGERPDGWFDGTDWADSERLELESSGIITWDDARDRYCMVPIGLAQG